MLPSNPIKETIYSINGVRTFKLSEFLESIKEETEKVPEEFRKSIQIRFDTLVNADEDLDPYVPIYYFRPQTKDELIKSEKEKADREKRIINQELAEYRRLKKKFDKNYV